MNNQQTYSHGLLYSIAPDQISALHLNSDEKNEEFDWGAHEAQLNCFSLVGAALSFMKTTAVMWGLIKQH
jgi:hypothetical protein